MRKIFMATIKRFLLTSYYNFLSYRKSKIAERMHLVLIKLKEDYVQVKIVKTKWIKKKGE